jgi:hypothetical protein
MFLIKKNVDIKFSAHDAKNQNIVKAYNVIVFVYKKTKGPKQYNQGLTDLIRELRICNTADLGDEFHYLLKCAGLFQ